MAAGLVRQLRKPTITFAAERSSAPTAADASSGAGRTRELRATRQVKALAPRLLAAGGLGCGVPAVEPNAPNDCQAGRKWTTHAGRDVSHGCIGPRRSETRHLSVGGCGGFRGASRRRASTHSPRDPAAPSRRPPPDSAPNLATIAERYLAPRAIGSQLRRRRRAGDVSPGRSGAAPRRGSLPGIPERADPCSMSFNHPLRRARTASWVSAAS